MSARRGRGKVLKDVFMAMGQPGTTGVGLFFLLPIGFFGLPGICDDPYGFKCFWMF